MASLPRTNMQWRKSDADDIAAFMRDLPKRLGLDRQRRWWPQWLYRSDHVENAAQILNSGRVLSRARAERSRVIVHDSASHEHVGQLTGQQRDCVRLYFRPRTPTQYANEGIRPTRKIKYDGAHMPVPVYLLFSVKLLECVGIEFTRGRLAIATETGGSYEFLSSIAFRDVYHDGPIGHRREILNSRHAEVIRHGSLNLDYLRHVVCRSSAERDTLLHLLSDEACLRWGERTIVDEGRRRLFHKRGTFLEEVSLGRNKIGFRFYENTHPEYRGPFDLRVIAKTTVGHQVGRAKAHSVDGRHLAFRLDPPLKSYTVQITLNGDLAYAGEYDGREVTDAILE